MAQDGKKVVLTDERRGQIALEYFKYRVRQKGIRVTPDMKRQITQEAKNVGIPEDEAMAFVEETLRELVDEAFAPARGVKVLSSTIRP